MKPIPGPEQEERPEDPNDDAIADPELVDPEEATEPEHSPELVYRRHFFEAIQRRLNYSVFALSVAAIPVGILAAYGTFGFRLAFGMLGDLFETSGPNAGIQKCLVLIGGGLILGWLLELIKWDCFRNPAHVIVSVHERGGKISLKDGLITALADAISLGAGASVGRYGPAIHLGAVFGSNIARSFRLGKTSVKILLGCGVAAAISASFNAPIAGVIFAHEVILGHFRLKAFAPITLASVAAVAITRFHHFEYVALKLSNAHRALNLWDYPAYLLIGFAAAGVAILYMSGIIRIGWLARKSKVPLRYQPAIGAAIAGFIALFLPSILGLGDDTIQTILGQDKSAQQFSLGLLLCLSVGKLLASASCIGLRMPGGSFSPAIFIGAAIGGAAGLVIPFIDYQIAVIVGMGAMCSSVIGAPLATILIVFELTENYHAATAVMVGVVSANALVTRLFSRSLFHRQIRAWGIDITRPEEQRVMQAKKVSEVMTARYIAVRPDRTVAELRKLVDHGYRSEVFVVDEDRKLIGQLSLSDLAISEGDVTAEELSTEPEIKLIESDSVWSGFVSLENFSGIAVPVVNNDEEMELMGAVYATDFVSIYRQAITQAREDEG